MSQVVEASYPKLTDALFDAYNIDRTATANSPEQTQAILQLGGDLTFADPAVQAALSWSQTGISGSQAFYYKFECPNPWQGPWTGHASHGLDTAFLLQNFNEYLASGQKNVAHQMARDFIAFVYGEDPWRAYEDNEKVFSMRYSAGADDDHDRTELASIDKTSASAEPKFLRNTVNTSQAEKVLDAWNMFMRGPPIKMH
jgi:hypothetical protein